jgi:hypothetical protein
MEPRRDGDGAAPRYRRAVLPGTLRGKAEQEVDGMNGAAMDATTVSVA